MGNVDKIMTGMSILRPAGRQCLQLIQRNKSVPLQKQAQTLGQISVRNGGANRIPIIQSKYDWTRFKNDLHFFLMLGAIPTFSLIAYANIFIGPAELAEIPEGYEPKPWEYEEHPIRRWFAKYIYEEPEKTHERSLDVLHRKREERYWKRLERKVKELQSDRLDYRGWYFTPAADKSEKEVELAALRERSKVLTGTSGGF